LAVAALAGCAHSGPAGAASNSSLQQPSTSRPASPPDPKVLLRAGASAVKAVPNGTLTLIKTQETGSWRVLVATPDGIEQRMDVSPDGYDVMVGPTPKTQSDVDKSQTRAMVQATHIDYRAAMDKIQAVVQYGGASEMNLVNDTGNPVWNADVWDLNIVEHLVTINAVTGDVIANKTV
jgi:uncharacterized membrane protein YkoI